MVVVVERRRGSGRGEAWMGGIAVAKWRRHRRGEQRLVVVVGVEGVDGDDDDDIQTTPVIGKVGSVFVNLTILYISNQRFN